MKTVKLIVVLVILLFLGTTESSYAQDKYGSEPDKCKTNLSIFYEYAKVKNYDAAFEPWTWCIENCPASSKNIYKYGLKMFEHQYDVAAGLITAAEGKAKGASSNPNIKTLDKKYYNTSNLKLAEMDKAAAEIDKLYDLRIKHFPENLGKVYSDWANSLFKRSFFDNKVRKEIIYTKLNKSFKANPTGMSVKNLGKYYQIFTNEFKDTDPQLVFDTYDDITETVGKKMDGYSKKLDGLVAKEKSGKTLSNKEKRSKNAAKINLKALGQIEGILDNTLSSVATCERLVPLYIDNFEKNKTDVKWLKRAVSRLNQKGCTDSEIYPIMVEAYVNAAPSSDAYVFYAGILIDKGENNKAIEYFNKATNLESDNYKKAKYFYRVALIMKNRGAKSKSREYALKALGARPSMGHAYLLIANLYASSANSCGTDEISKRMVYVAAANKARRAKSVDPGITSTANKYIKSYMGSAPSKKLIFTEGLASGSPIKIGCWIGETVRIP